MISDRPDDLKTLATRHLQFAWWSLLCFVILGITLESLHAFKIGWYLKKTPEIEMRRWLWTLAHAHGVVLSLVHATFALTLWNVCEAATMRQRFASLFLISASVLLPGGFFLGGIVIYAGDPGLGILLVPPGAGLLFAAVLLTALGAQAELGASSAAPQSSRND